MTDISAAPPGHPYLTPSRLAGGASLGRLLVPYENRGAHWSNIDGLTASAWARSYLSNRPRVKHDWSSTVAIVDVG